MGVSSESLAAVSSDAIGSDGGGNSSTAGDGSHVLFGHVKPAPPLPDVLASSETRVAQIIAPEARALERTCAKLIGLLCQVSVQRKCATIVLLVSTILSVLCGVHRPS